MTHKLIRKPESCFFGLFVSVIVVVFQSIFHLEMYQDMFFLFFKNYFLISVH
jgi:hypothetical protein